MPSGAAEAVLRDDGDAARGAVTGALRRAQRSALALIVALGLVLRFLKAHRAPITYDEAFSLLHFASLPWVDVFRDYNLPNNHILNTLIMKAVSFFDDSELALRLCSVAASGFMLWSCFVLARRAIGVGAALAVTLWLATQPMLVSYGALARGYGIGLALFFGGVAWTLTRLEHAQRPALLWPCAIPCGLAISSVPTFAHGVAAFFGAMSLSVLLGHVTQWAGRSKLRSCTELASALFLPAGLLAASTYAWITKWPRGFPWGYDRLDIAIQALMNGVLQVQLELAVALVIAVTLWTAVLAWSARAWMRREQAPLVLGTTLCIIPLIFVAQHLTRGVKYPFDRTWIYVTPLAAIGLFGVLNWLAERLGARLRDTLMLVMTGAAVAFNVSKLDLMRTPPWEHLVEVKPAMKHLSEVTPNATLCIRWDYDAAFEYYARRYGINLRESCHIERDTYVFTSAADLAQYPKPDPAAIVYEAADGSYLLYGASPLNHVRSRERRSAAP